MKDGQVACSMERGTDAIADRFRRWSPRRRDVSDLVFARRAIDRRQFEDAERHLRRALDQDTDSAEARSLMGVLHEGWASITQPTDASNWRLSSIVLTQ
jgi:hypothetical protein